MILDHLARLTDARGIVEHADGARPARRFGYCTDDAGRLLGLVAALPPNLATRRLALAAVGFLEAARSESEVFRLRRIGDDWTDDQPSDDATGRALQGLAGGAHAPWADVRRRSRALLESVGSFTSPFARASAHVVLAAVTLLERDPTDPVGRRLLDDGASGLPEAGRDTRWPWPEPRLTYANALLPEALLAGAHARGDASGAERALRLLAWLVVEETRGDHFSFVPATGRGPRERGPAFDQQPIEAWAMADAATRAWRLTGDPHWAEVVRMARAWFAGRNDVGITVGDVATGAGFDGLRRDGVNHNQGAESTMAFVATCWRAAQVSGRAGPRVLVEGGVA